MSTGYTKLFSSIVTSTIWVESDRTRIVWITMLAMADKNGEVQASIPGLARLAGVPIPDCEEAIAKFMAPDPYSRTPDDEGRRIEKIDGGWALLNHKKYREMASREDSKAAGNERVRRWRAKEKRNGVKRDVTPCNGLLTQDLHIAEADTDAEADKDIQTPLPPKGGMSALEVRAGKLFRKRPDTLWDHAESKAFAKNKHVIAQTPESDWQALEKFYAAPQSETYARTSLATLLNNWNGEIDRAHKWQSKAAPTVWQPKLRIE